MSIGGFPQQGFQVQQQNPLLYQYQSMVMADVQDDGQINGSPLLRMSAPQVPVMSAGFGFGNAGTAGIPFGNAGTAGIPFGNAGTAGIPFGNAGTAGIPFGNAGTAGIPYGYGAPPVSYPPVGYGGLGTAGSLGGLGTAGSFGGPQLGAGLPFPPPQLGGAGSSGGLLGNAGGLGGGAISQVLDLVFQMMTMMMTFMFQGGGGIDQPYNPGPYEPDPPTYPPVYDLFGNPYDYDVPPRPRNRDVVIDYGDDGGGGRVVVDDDGGGKNGGGY